MKIDDTLMENLDSQSNQDLVAIFNELAGKTGDKQVSRFKNKAEAIERITELYGRKDLINWPYAGKVEHKVRESSLQGKVREALRGGATLEELGEIVIAHDAETGKQPQGKPESRGRSIMRMLHTYNGYGVRQVGDRFHLIES